MTLKPIVASGSPVYLERIIVCAFANTNLFNAKKSPDAIETFVPTPVAGFATVSVVCTVTIAGPPVNVSPAETRTGVVPAVPPDVDVYRTNNVAGSEPSASIASSTSIPIEFVPEIRFVPTQVPEGNVAS